MKDRNQQLEQARAQIKAECWDSMEVHRETVSALKAPLKVGPASHFLFFYANNGTGARDLPRDKRALCWAVSGNAGGSRGTCLRGHCSW